MQVTYAAKDALVAVDIFLSLLQEKLTDIDIKENISDDKVMLWTKILGLCQGLKDIRYRQSGGGHASGDNGNKNVVSVNQLNDWYCTLYED